MKTPPPQSESEPWSELDLEIQPFEHYSLLLDARTPGEYFDDHIPGAVNLPVFHNDQSGDACLRDLGYAIAGIAKHIKTHHSPRDRMLVYCCRGGQRSSLWAENLRRIGFKVDVLPGGWRAYRRWVLANLSTHSKNCEYRVIAGSTGAGKTRLLHALEAEGGQVLDLEGIACHRGSLSDDLPAISQPSQNLFDSLLFQKLRSFKSDRYVWIESWSKKIGRVHIPAAMRAAMHNSPVYLLEAEIGARVRLWHEDYGHYKEDFMGMLDKKGQVTEIIGSKLFAEWRERAAMGQASELFQSMMLDYYDRVYKTSLNKNYKNLSEATRLSPKDLGQDSMRALARSLLADSHKPPLH
jgi:tRNA 2-selenouridine synthase